MADIIDEALKNKTLSDLKKLEVVSGDKPSLTAEKVESAIRLLKDVEKNNGHTSIARTVGLTREQVAEIHSKMKEKISELSKDKEII